MRISHIAKAVVGAVGTLATAATAALADDVLSLDEGAQLTSTAVLAIGTVYLIWRTPNRDGGTEGRR